MAELPRRLVKSVVNERQIAYRDELSKEIETAILNHDPASAYAMIRRLKDGQQNSENNAVQDKNGKLFITSMDKLDRRKEYFYELFNVKSFVGSNVIYHNSTPSIPTTEQDRQNKPSTLDELDQVLKRMKSQKAPGNDDVSTDKFKAGELPVLKWLHEISVDIWQNEEIVEN
ncbi:unnamed protein product [Rotaria sp. Silwood1]|nr:unnamed protein product [Rotaria sp. Silwood1]CAF5022344.1 unnamed protein product [Rotaria sp. Silwood1]